MRIISLTDNTIHNFISSVVVSDHVADAIVKVIVALGGGNYINFVHTVFNTHGRNYKSLNAPDIELTHTEVLRIQTTLHAIDPLIPIGSILVADKLDILYGSDYRSFEDYTKFNTIFYEMVYDLIAGTGANAGDAQSELVFEETVRAIEYIFSIIEQCIVFTGTECETDDYVVICPLPRVGALFFIVM